MPLGAIDPQSRIYIAGHRWLVGSAAWRALTSAGLEHLIGIGSDKLDLRDRGAVFDFMRSTRPNIVILATGVGASGIVRKQRDSAPAVPAVGFRRHPRLGGPL